MSDSTNPKDLLGVKKAPLRLVPPALVIETSAVMALGATKYGPYNWREKDVKLSVYLEAMLRHLVAVLDGQWLDPESGRPHVAHISAGVGIVLDAAAIGRLIEDWPVFDGPAAVMLENLDQSKPQELATPEARDGGCGDPECCPSYEPKTMGERPTRMQLVEVLAALGIARPLATADALLDASTAGGTLTVEKQREPFA